MPTRRSLHGMAELVLAGPQFRLSGSIELRASAGGFATTHEPDVRVEGVTLVAGDLRTSLRETTTFERLAASVGLVASGLDDVYGDGPGPLPTDLIDVDEAAAAEIAGAFQIGDEALRQLAPDQEPVLWPEHFDIGVTVDAVNYGVSPGDNYLGEPYAYVGPWERSDLSGEFWDAPFGSARPLLDLGGVSDVLAYFEKGRALVGRAAQEH
jgi:hypothetical protein